MRKILTHSKALKTAILFLGIVFWSLSAFAQHKEYLNVSPSITVHDNQEIFHVLIKIETYSEMYRLRNYCTKQNKLAEKCFNRRAGTAVVKDFSNKKQADDFLNTAFRAGVLKDKKVILVLKDVYDYYENCDISFYGKFTKN